MRAVAIDRFGPPDVMKLVEVPLTPIGPADARVRVHAAGVNPLDYKIRDGSSGLVKDFGPDDFPIVLGRECCGTVEAVGEDVDHIGVGQRVFGMAPLKHRGGCYAESANLPADCLVPAPEGVGDVTLAGTALVALTAWAAVHDLGQVQPCLLYTSLLRVRFLSVPLPPLLLAQTSYTHPAPFRLPKIRVP